MSKKLKTIIKNTTGHDTIFDQIIFDEKLNTLKFVLNHDHQLNPDAIKDMILELEQAMPYVNNVEIEKPIVVSKKRLSLLDYWEEAVDIATKQMPSIKSMLLNADRRELKNELMVTLENQYALDVILEKKMDTVIKKYFRDTLNENITIKWSSQDEDQMNAFIEEQQNRMDHMIKTNQHQSTDKSGKQANKVVYKRMTKGKVYKITELEEEQSRCVIHSKVFDISTRELRGGKVLMTLSVTDFSDSMGVKLFLEKNEFKSLEKKIEVDEYYSFEGSIRYDDYSKELMFHPSAINTIAVDEVIRQDNCEQKRVELHLHTNMSEMDGITSVKDLVKRASDWGHQAMAVTDHGVIQAFPDAMSACESNDIKVIYGLEGYLYDNITQMVKNPNNKDFDQEFVVFDIETTGFSYTADRIIEIGAVKIKDKEIRDTFNILIDPKMALPIEIIELTGIRDEDLKNQPTIDEALPKFLEFVGDLPVVAHNADFDTSFINYNCKENHLKFDSIVIDTLKISRIVLKQLKRHRLSSLVKYYGITLENHHRAVDDAIATSKVFIEQLREIENRGFKTMDQLNYLNTDVKEIQSYSFTHFTVLTKTQKGLKNLYHMISESHLRYYYKKPRLSKTLVNQYREGLLIGSACDGGEIYQAFLKGLEPEDVLELAEFYDYFEVMPIENSMHLIRSGRVKDEQQLKDIVSKFIKLGEITQKLVVATGDVHFLEPDDQIYRKILMAGQKYRDFEQPPLYFKTTEEMLDDFNYLDNDKAWEIVVTNTNLIADSVDEGILPIPKGTFPPKIEGSDDDLKKMCFKTAHSIYGDVLPEIVEKRLNRELNSIISNGYAVMYIIAHNLVAKSLEDGYLVGSRGSVGSSFAATMSGITEVNPLPPHYVCSKCKNSEFIKSTEYGSGVDLPDKICPVCGSQYKKDGHDIPFEVFLGFEGDKEPDIDLNFAGVYQATSHKYTETLFGKGYVYKAGTIGTVADKTAYGYVKNYFEDREIKVSNREINRLTKGCTGIRRTTGQHPGGIMVVPSYKDIHDFTPIQYPANDVNSDVITTHFDYHSISGRILKLDILGHDVPTIIRQIEKLTGVNIQEVPLDDPATISLFTKTEALNILDASYKEEIGSLGIPEFGTKFVRQMLKETQPSTFSELVRISGLSHGTDVWVNNAQDLVKQNIAELKDVISTRDDIMNYLIANNLPDKESFTIMERVRKGKGLTDEQVKMMKEFKIPQWYIDSCNTIQYMFPKAHAVAYVMMSFRIAYFKVHHPLAFYATYFSTKVSDFDGAIMIQGKSAIVSKMKEIQKMDSPSKKDLDLYTLLEVAFEMYSRGYEFTNVDLYQSHYNEFELVDGKILPPLQALNGVGENASKNIYDEARIKEFISKEDLRIRSKSTKTVIEALTNNGCLKMLPDTNQLQFLF